MRAPTPELDARGVAAATLRGIGMMLLAIAIFGFVNAFTKAILATYPPTQALFIRGFAAMAVLIPFIARDNWAALRTIRRPGLQVVRAILSGSDAVMFFIAIRYIPLADATTCYLAAPIFVTALSAIFLKERVGWRRWSAVVIGFIGVLIALRPTSASFSWPALVALCGCFCQSIFMLITRKVRGTDSTFLSLTQVIASFVIGASGSAMFWVPPSWTIVGLLLISGIVNVAGVFCLNRSLTLAPASVVAPYQYTIIIWAILLGYLAFGDVPQWTTLLGAAIVTGAGIYIFVRERALLRREPQPNPPPV